jgi:hypothetical protein
MVNQPDFTAAAPRHSTWFVNRQRAEINVLPPAQ